MRNLREERLGEQFKTNEGYIIEIVEYNNKRNVLVEFQDEHKTRIPTEYACCQKGMVRNPYHKSVYGVGYFGQGKYKCKVDGKNSKYYNHWHNMMQRCYDEKCREKYPTYKDCFVNEEAHCLQDFGAWFDENYYEIEGEQMELDKDILCKGNKEYSFDKMIFVPKRINDLFTKCDRVRGDLPIGIYYKKSSNKYVTQCQTLEGKKHLGYFDTPHEAFQAYKTFKEAYIKQVADEYKDKIPQRLYDAMYAWEVEIDD